MLKGGRHATPKKLYVGHITLVELNKSRTRGTYLVELDDKRGQGWKQAIVKDFPRKRLLAWDLLRWCLNAAIGSER